MIDEANLESHGSWQKLGARGAQLERAGQPAGMEGMCGGPRPQHV